MHPQNVLLDYCKFNMLNNIIILALDRYLVIYPSIKSDYRASEHQQIDIYINYIQISNDKYCNTHNKNLVLTAKIYLLLDYYGF